MKLIIRRYGRSVEEQMAGIVENILTMIGSVEPVSYTHLDVYKRQTVSC